MTLMCLHNILWTNGWILTKFSWIYNWDKNNKMIRSWWPWPNFQGHSSRKTENSGLCDICFLWKHCSSLGVCLLCVSIINNLPKNVYTVLYLSCLPWGWLGVAKVCILFHWGVQLILAHSWARPAILVAGKGRGEYFYFFCFFTFIPFPLSSLSVSFISSPLLSLLCFFSLSLLDDTKWPTRADVSLNHNTIKSCLP